MNLADMLNDGYLQKHTRKLERLFAGRRRMLIYELKRTFGSNVHVPTQTGGLTMMVRFQEFSDEALVEAARRANLTIISSRPFYVNQGVSGEYLIYFAGLEEAGVRKKVTSFAQHLQGLS
jgi:DNA-binding transcriptional MocR family regulator